MAATEEYCLLPKPFEVVGIASSIFRSWVDRPSNLACLGVLRGGWLTCSAGGGLLASLIDTHQGDDSNYFSSSSTSVRCRRGGGQTERRDHTCKHCSSRGFRSRVRATMNVARKPGLTPF